MKINRKNTRIWLVGLAVFAAVFSFTFLKGKYEEGEEAEAASLAKFDPGYIISDYQMGNYNSMSEAEIQTFLTAKNPCNNKDSNYYKQLTASNPEVSWHFENGHFICLSEEKFGDGEVIGAGETAAHIIWQTAQDYKINPQVLLVLLQKETSLITDPIPNNYDYRKATGYGCPDTAACSAKYYGFKNQVRNAAALFRTVLDGGWTNYPLGKNYVQYNPNKECGGSEVDIKSLATSALYRYTPYQPNASALAAGYGEGDSCGAYGNRNFYMFFEDWFGGVTEEGAKTPAPEEPKGVTSDTPEEEDVGGIDDEEAEQKRKADMIKEVSNTSQKGQTFKTVDAINELWESMGASKSSLGYPIENYGYDAKTDMYWQGFQNGYIVGTTETGFYESAGAIRTYWSRQGYQSGSLGVPISDIGYDKKVGMYWQEYQGGFVVGSSATGWHKSFGGIREFWARTGYQAGHLGMPLEEVGYDSSTGMSWQRYQNGFVVGSDKTGWYESAGTIRDYWAKNGYQTGKFGMPIGDIYYDVNSRIYHQKYQNGTIFYDENLRFSYGS